jgi:tetratricopeptide (TPR) repeat protein
MTTDHSQTMTIDVALQQAVTHHQAGRLQDAEQLYRAILQVQPTHSDANHNLGILAIQVHKADEGIPYFKAALESNQKQGQYWLSYIDALIQAGQDAAAREVLGQARQFGLQGEKIDVLEGRLTIGLPDSKNNAKLRFNKSEKFPSRTISREPSQEEMSKLAVLFNQGNYAEAESLSYSLTERFPQHGFGWKVLGAVLHKFGRIEASLQAKRKATEMQPDDAEAHNNLGNSLREHGRLTEAEGSLRKALELKPDYAEAYNNLGMTLYGQGRFSEAEICYRYALKLKPDYADACNNLGNMLYEQGIISEAEDCFLRALDITSGSVSNVSQLVAYNYAVCLGERGLHRESVSFYQQAFSERVGWHHAEDRELSSGLAHAYVELTNKCNFHCDFCPSDSQQRMLGFMDLELICKLYDEFTEKNLVKQVDLHLMGEPTLHPNLVEVLNYAASKRIKTELVTNGSTLNSKTVPRILDALNGVFVVSLQTPTQGTFKHRGDTRLSWSRYIENIRVLVREYLKRVALKHPCRNTLELRVMITKNSKLSANIIESLDDIHGVMQEWCNFVANVEVEFGLVAFNRKELPSGVFAMSASQTNIRYPLQQGLTLTFWQGFTFANSMLSSEYALEHEETVTFCSRPFLDVAVLSNGEVTLCCLDYDGKLAVGNMKGNTIEAILNGKRTMDLRAAMYGRHPLPLFCRQCQARTVLIPSSKQDISY